VSVLSKVECYSGYTYAQEPRAFEWDGVRYEVVRVVKRWRTPTGPIFRVEVVGVSGSQHLNGAPAQVSPIARRVDLKYLELEDMWTMTVQT
jgi:hypothetical protein